MNSTDTICEEHLVNSNGMCAHCRIQVDVDVDDMAAKASTELIAKIARKTEEARQSHLFVQGLLASLASDPEKVTAYAVNDYAIVLAGAEGAYSVWARIEAAANYHLRNDRVLTEAILADISAELLLTGADDSWSGRGNDVRRARFDGVRDAVRNVRYL